MKGLVKFLLLIQSDIKPAGGVRTVDSSSYPFRGWFHPCRLVIIYIHTVYRYIMVRYLMEVAFAEEKSQQSSAAKPKPDDLES
jgi:hypothetical protein